jgi:hypothetical protein
MPRVTKTQLDRWAAASAKVTALNREIAALRSDMREVASAAEADLASSGNDHINRGGYRIDWAEGRLGIAWKDELIARCGPEVAVDIAASVGTKKTVRITDPEALRQSATRSQASTVAKPKPATKPATAAKTKTNTKANTKR